MAEVRRSAARVLNAVMRDGVPTRVVILPAEDRGDQAYAALEINMFQE